MFWQQKDIPNIGERTKIWSWQTMILLINMIMNRAPEFSKTMVAPTIPIGEILMCPMSTAAGLTAFSNDKVWNSYSMSPCFLEP
jgi:hypothetical protein